MKFQSSGRMIPFILLSILWVGIDVGSEGAERVVNEIFISKSRPLNPVVLPLCPRQYRARRCWINTPTLGSEFKQTIGI